MKEIKTANAPAAIGPYSQGIEAAGTMVFVSGQLPIDPKTGAFPGDDIESQTRQSLTNIKAILEEAGYTMKDVVKATVLLKNIGDFVNMNKVYGEFLKVPALLERPSRLAPCPKMPVLKSKSLL